MRKRVAGTLSDVESFRQNSIGEELVRGKVYLRARISSQYAKKKTDKNQA